MDTLNVTICIVCEQEHKHMKPFKLSNIIPNMYYVVTKENSLPKTEKELEQQQRQQILILTRYSVQLKTRF